MGVPELALLFVECFVEFRGYHVFYSYEARVGKVGVVEETLADVFVLGALVGK